LYEVPLKYRISGTLVSSKDNQPIGGAAVKITGNDGFSQVVQTGKDGSFVLESDDLAGDVNYSFSFEKKKFLNSGARANTQALALEAFNYMEAQNVYMHTVEVKAKMDPIEIPIILPDVYFALAKWDLNDQARAALDTVVKTLTLNPNIVIELRSHTDYRDVDDKNQILSQHRADTSVSYLISRGIHPDRLVAVGMGESQPFEIPAGYKGLGADLFPVGTQLTERNIKKMPASQQEVANQINRRTDFRVIRDDYVPPVDSAALAEAEAEKAKEDDKPVIGQMYTVQERDTYTTICRNNNITISDLKRLNGGLRGVRPFPGMVLKVTVRGDYTEFDKTHRQVAVGESFRSIAKELGMRPKELEALNPEYEDELPAGTYIRIQ
jgi:peptidoglycan-associated lipoprotein